MRTIKTTNRIGGGNLEIEPKEEQVDSTWKLNWHVVGLYQVRRRAPKKLNQNKLIAAATKTPFVA